MAALFAELRISNAPIFFSRAEAPRELSSKMAHMSMQGRGEEMKKGVFPALLNCCTNLASFLAELIDYELPEGKKTIRRPIIGPRRRERMQRRKKKETKK